MSKELIIALILLVVLVSGCVIQGGEITPDTKSDVVKFDKEISNAGELNKDLNMTEMDEVDEYFNLIIT